MNIHEYQAKAVLKSYGAPVADGVAIFSADEAEAAANKLGGPLWVVKSQIHAGGRGKGKFKELSDKIAVERQKRENLAVRIDKPTFRLYERIMKSRSNNAVVQLRNGSCGGCFAEVPLQKVADIRKADRLYTCDICGRILYYEEN